jgi:hypothetical protein
MRMQSSRAEGELLASDNPTIKILWSYPSEYQDVIIGIYSPSDELSGIPS